MKFSDLQLHPALQANLDQAQFLECTPIQEKAFPLLRQGRDLSGLAQTGTGKTGAFLLPLIDRMLKAVRPDANCEGSETIAFPDWKKKQYVLILVPTRELAEQVQENAQMFLKDTGFSSVSIYGGTTYEKQIAALKEGVEFVIATPGRFIDLYKDHVADLGLVRAIVFDEADRMFDMGFREDMKFILKRVPRERQFLVFSATLNFEVLNVAYENGADPVEINISRNQAKADNVKDYMVHLGQEDKPRYLLSLIKKHNPRQAIIFSNFKHNVERIAKFLSINDVPAMGISSLLTQTQRNRVMAQFKAENESNILVATDVAARGLDILGVDLVLNFDLPDDPENYVHRIGRTGRAGQTGQAFSMVGDRDVDALQRIEDFLGNKLEVIWMDDTDLVKDFKPIPREERHNSKRRSEGGPNARSGGGRPPRGEGRPPRNGPPRGERDRDREPRPRREGGAPAQAAGSGPRHESHRDRQSGRHREPQGNGPNPRGHHASGGQGQPRAAGGNPNRRPMNGKAPHGRPAPSGVPGKIIPRSDKRHPLHPDNRANQNRGKAAAGPGASGGANAGLGQKVTGFLKRLFGKES